MNTSLTSGNPTIAQLHTCYSKLTGTALSLDPHREHVWCYFMAKGFTEADLTLVIAHLKRQISLARRQSACLKFHNLIAQLDYFEEDLQDARNSRRNRPRSHGDRSEVLRVSGRTDSLARHDATPEAHRAGELAFEALKRLRDSL